MRRTSEFARWAGDQDFVERLTVLKARVCLAVSAHMQTAIAQASSLHRALALSSGRDRIVEAQVMRNAKTAAPQRAVVFVCERARKSELQVLE
jgi:hypothetical protein